MSVLSGRKPAFIKFVFGVGNEASSGIGHKDLTTMDFVNHHKMSLIPVNDTRQWCFPFQLFDWNFYPYGPKANSLSSITYT